ncbi:type 1 glutamine amidotransferase domain-containing protein [Vibrio sp.]|uniref:Type 1 glutamine amidotransferase domain-containing protein n=1 Tax=Vibrio viridaestus TaxID=2487322 RepID=A0A3N9TGL5_9VIBR|nr:type 1 glutamine amidotransferase domain-containing protein [Vibrio viridaestus]MDC0610832.1 type 1 glutamine amidotransferase domain-containing protein [Vibrio sp.]RQW62615.1 type 1 glutamine amidotransferase domain-containing protein [Vibrio viridaestus]
MKILMVLTSHEDLGTTGEKTGFWLEEFAAPYYTFIDSGAEVTLASPKGGQPPLDPKSELEDFQTDYTRRFNSDSAAQSVLANTVQLATIKESEFDAVFYPGGHGPLWDLANSEDSIALIESFAAADKTIGFVCHAPGVLVNVKSASGEHFVKGRKVTGFTNGEEAGVQLTDVVPFLIEDTFIAQGADYQKGPDWGTFIVEDGKLITGQNPASSEAVAEALLKQLGQK